MNIIVNQDWSKIEKLYFKKFVLEEKQFEKIMNLNLPCLK